VGVAPAYCPTITQLRSARHSFVKACAMMEK
jgi:hypothetical protein